jgi:hypothetical protein
MDEVSAKVFGGFPPRGWLQGPLALLRWVEPSATSSPVHPVYDHPSIDKVATCDGEAFETVIAELLLSSHICLVSFTILVVRTVVLPATPATGSNRSG